MNGSVKLSLVIPVYNGGSFLGEKIPVLLSWLAETMDRELILVNDGSTDTTAALVETLRTVSNCVVIHHEHNQGKGAALRTGFRMAKGTFVAFTDADVPYGLKILDEMKAVMDNDLTLGIVYGSRNHAQSDGLKNYGMIRRIGRNFFSNVIRWSIVSDVFDSQCGIKLFRQSFVQDVVRCARINRFAFDVELFVIAKARGYHYQDFAVTLTHRRDSSVRLVKDTLSMLWDILKIRWRARQGDY